MADATDVEDDARFCGFGSEDGSWGVGKEVVVGLDFLVVCSGFGGLGGGIFGGFVVVVEGK